MCGAPRALAITEQLLPTLTDDVPALIGITGLARLPPALLPAGVTRGIAGTGVGWGWIGLRECHSTDQRGGDPYRSHHRYIPAQSVERPDGPLEMGLNAEWA